MSNVVKFPYSASRRVHSQKPRRSKNGRPEERGGESRGAGNGAGRCFPYCARTSASAFGGRWQKLSGSPLRIGTISFGATR